MSESWLSLCFTLGHLCFLYLFISDACLPFCFTKECFFIFFYLVVLGKLGACFLIWQTAWKFNLWCLWQTVRFTINLIKNGLLEEHNVHHFKSDREGGGVVLFFYWIHKAVLTLIGPWTSLHVIRLRENKPQQLNDNIIQNNLCSCCMCLIQSLPVWTKSSSTCSERKHNSGIRRKPNVYQMFQINFPHSSLGLFRPIIFSHLCRPYHLVNSVPLRCLFLILNRVDKT